MHIGTFAGYARRLEETSSRTALVAVLAELFAAATPDDVAPATYLLQGRLHAIAETAGSGSAARKVALLAEVLTPLDPASAAFVSRLPLGTLRLGLGDPTILDAYSVATVGNRSLRPRLERAYNETSDLGLIGMTLWERGIDAVDVLGIRVGNPVRPALAERLPSAEAILAQLGPCAVESKYDGFRCQVHKDGATVRIYSRSLEEMTDAFPEIARGVTTQIAAQTAIIEGEALAYHPASDEYLPFQQTMRRRRKHGIAEAAATLPLRLFAFDVLYADGERVAERPYAERHALLRRLIHAGEAIQVAQSRTVGTAEELMTVFDAAIGAGLEGIVAKKLNAPYQAGARNYTWVKLKRAQAGHLRDTVDCVIIGYLYGRGRRAAFGVGALLLAVEVLADEITRSPIHAAGRGEGREGYALRFPRLVSFRDADKRPEDATTVAEIIALYQQQGGMPTTRTARTAAS